MCIDCMQPGLGRAWRACVRAWRACVARVCGVRVASYTLNTKPDDFLYRRGTHNHPLHSAPIKLHLHHEFPLIMVRCSAAARLSPSTRSLSPPLHARRATGPRAGGRGYARRATGARLAGGRGYARRATGPRAGGRGHGRLGAACTQPRPPGARVPLSPGKKAPRARHGLHAAAADHPPPSTLRPLLCPSQDLQRHPFSPPLSSPHQPSSMVRPAPPRPAASTATYACATY